MAYPLRATDNLQFQVKQFVKKFWQKWVDPIPPEPKGHFAKSDAPISGMTPMYLFDLITGDQLQLSRDQWQQALVAAFDAKKHWKDCAFVIKTNGKTGKEVRYYINLLQAHTSVQTQERPIYPQNPVEPPQTAEFEPTDDINLDSIPF